MMIPTAEKQNEKPKKQIKANYIVKDNKTRILFLALLTKNKSRKVKFFKR